MHILVSHHTSEGKKARVTHQHRPSRRIHHLILAARAQLRRGAAGGDRVGGIQPGFLVRHSLAVCKNADVVYRDQIAGDVRAIAEEIEGVLLLRDATLIGVLSIKGKSLAHTPSREL
jgi:hypothetical protein